MPNWCTNTVAFTGNPDAIEQIRQLFITMAEKEKQDEMGQLPHFTSLQNGYFFDNYQNEGETGIFWYYTKWAPNIKAVQEIADHFKVEFVLDYHELGCLIYGKATYQNGILTDIYLDDEDFDTYRLDDQFGYYHFENTVIGDEFDILDILLERKITKINAKQ